MEDKKVILSIKDLKVKFRVRGRILTAIRGISLDIYENESIAIVGESGSGKSVFTKTFAGMLDSNGYISDGSIVFNDEELADTVVAYDSGAKNAVKATKKRLNGYSKLEAGAKLYRKCLELEKEKNAHLHLTDEEKKQIEQEIHDLKAEYANLYNLKLTYDSKKEKDEIKAANDKLKGLEEKIAAAMKKEKQMEADKKAAYAKNTEYQNSYKEQKAKLNAEYDKVVSEAVLSDDTIKRNEILAKEIFLSVGRYPYFKRLALIKGLEKAVKEAMKLGVDIDDDSTRNAVFDNVAFRVKYLDETSDKLHGTCVLNLANVKYAKDWTQIRGKKIATVFQDPMTSLNPIITIGKQISSVIIKHQGCSEIEARAKAIELMHKVGIPNAAARYDDYPFEYSGGMRQRIVIAIALSCQPKILICDEPTTALDVTIQAQILKLIKDLQKEFNYTIVFITHDLGVVANIADRVAVLYAGQIVELGKVEEIFYDPKHPYTWALLSSLPQLAQRNTKLFSITGTPPSLYNEIVGDAFAPRNKYCLQIDTLMEPPMFKVTDTHYAKTWLLDERAPKIDKPEAICDIHEKLVKAFNI